MAAEPERAEQDLLIERADLGPGRRHAGRQG
jgi:hypothetical protein